MKNKKRNYLLRLYFLPSILALIGSFFVFEASSIRSFQESGDSFYYFKLQLIWVAVSLVLMLFFSLFDYHNWYYLAFILMTVTIASLFLVLVPGVGSWAGGARRWIDLGIINFQPTELAKLSTIIYLSSWFINRERKRFFSFVLILALLMFLIFLQPDMGTALIIFSLSIVVYFLAGIEIHYLLLLVPVSFLGFFFLVKVSPYRLQRLLAFFNPKFDPLGITYHLNQIINSLGNGGLLGQGFGASRQKYLILPEAHTDSIFAIIAEEFGFVGAAVLIAIFYYFSLTCYRVITMAKDRFGKLLAGGIYTYFNLQFIINLGGIVNLIPLTGVPLSFISYGGSSLLTSFVLLGILINIGRQGQLR